MSIIYFPSCKFTAQYPETSKKIKEYMKSRHNAQIAGCCKPNLNKITVDDTVVYICNTCAAFFNESSSANSVISIWELLLTDENFTYPDYECKRLCLQDCWRTYDNKAQQEVVRKILAHMNIDVVELVNNYEKTRFCGFSLYEPLPDKYDELAPKRLVEDAQGYFIPHSQEEKEQLMKDHCNSIATEEVICYCIACANGISLGGKKGEHLSNLVFNKQ